MESDKSRSPEFLALKGSVELLIDNGFLSLAEGTCFHYYRELDLRRKIDTMNTPLNKRKIENEDPKENQRKEHHG